MAKSEFVHIAHDEVEATGYVTREALDVVWAEKGWQEVSAAAVAASEATGEAVTDLNALKRDQLADLAFTQYGIDSNGLTKADIIAAIESATA